MTRQSAYQQVLDYANRANPYPLYAQLRQTPVAQYEDGSYVVSTHREIVALLHDPRIGSDMTKGAQLEPDLIPGFITLDPPEHGRLRRMAMRHFGPPHRAGWIDGMRDKFADTVQRLIDNCRGRRQIDIVDDLAYPLPVCMICDMLGVPLEDEPRFQRWTQDFLDGEFGTPQQRQRGEQAIAEMREYITEIAVAYRRQPGDTMLSRWVTDDNPDGQMSMTEIADTGVLLLIGGHETTVNLIANGMLTLLRHPEVMERLRREPDLVIPLVEELLRYEPPAQITPRVALADISLAGVTIPRGAKVNLLLAAGNRDPRRFTDPDLFVPDRPDNQHLGFGHGIHACFGAPMARLETQIALTALVGRLESPRLVVDPPPYRRNPLLRGPRHLVVTVEGVRA
ncbi:Biotin biosynthesis cytochrome P450 [Mycobacterium innocens]|uniref:Biotin biosynthesis cytochrome P450 n=1 Tax=Mycobacterium innocens TaxID=2341083 RepID=A0A498Q248_9MYCO|nr:cytochrome P450 [Mycobacterium innocens]VBA39946.1 Biotin biosynthesis cytochrome P450 [Mycobacterium innocens]